MNQGDRFPPPFLINQWLIQPDLNRITGSDGPVQVEPRVMQVLLALAARPKEVVTRLQLLDEVWGDAVVGEEILTRAVSELRRIFGDDARQPAYIETIRNHGYRLIAPLQSAKPTPLPAAEPTRSRRRPAKGVWLAAVALLVAVGVMGPQWLDQNPDVGQPFAPTAEGELRHRPLTSYAGREMHPALSPDGTRVAFAWADQDGRIDIHIKQRNSESTLRLTDDPAWAAWPVWSPDGQKVAFVQGTAAGSAICEVPSLGGAVRILHEVDGWVEGLDWDPTGETLIYAAFEPVAKKNRLHLLSLSNYDTELLAAARPDNAGDYQPRFSPDGRQVAWKGRAPGGGTGLYVADRQGGAVKTVVEGLVPIQGLAWSPDGSSLIYAAAPAGRFNLWQVDLARGETHWVPTPGDFAWNPTVALRSGDLAYEQVRMDQDLWRIRIREREPWELETDRFLASTRWEYEADFHPDGQSIVFVSARSGQPELWRCDAQGENLQQLTFLGPAGIGNPRWSPQGDRIAFNLIQDGKTAIMIVQGQGSDPVPVDFGAGKVSFSSWSGDGQALLVGADRGQGWNIHRLDLADGQTRSLTRDGGLTAMESPSGEFLYYTRPDRPGLWRRSLQNDGGAEDPQRVVADLNHLDRNHWRIIMTDGGRSDLYWVERNAGGAFLLWRDLATEQTSFVTELPGLAGSSLAISPAGDAVLYPRTGSAAGDLMILEHFFPSGK